MQQEENLQKISSPHDKVKIACKGEPVRQQHREEILKLLVMLMNFVGVQPENFPNKLTKNMLVNYIMGHLGDYTINEFTLAFSLAVSGRLDVDVRHFNSFDAIYLNKIMTAYGKYKRMFQQKETLMLNPKGDELTKEEIEQIMRDGILEYFAAYKEQKHKHIKPSIFFQYLKDKGLMKYTATEATECMEQARGEMIGQKKEEQAFTLSRKRYDSLATEIRKLIEGAGDMESIVKERAKVLIMHKYFDELIQANTELEGLI